jgi:arginase
MGAGPEHFVRGGLASLLSDDGHEVETECVEASTDFPAEIKTAFEVARALAVRVRDARARGIFPVVLSGNCNASLGTLAGVGTAELGMVWFDAHGDFNTPEISESSLLDGMGMAVAAGRCWRKLAATIQGFAPLPESNVVHVGGRDFDSEESVALETSGVRVVGASEIRRAGLRASLAPTLDVLRERVSKIYLHVDFDVLDPAEAPANEYGARVPEGLRVAQVEEAIQLLCERFRICAAGFAAYDPSYDEDGRTFAAGVRLMKTLLASA